MPIVSEDKEAKALLQGIWVDELTEDVVFKIEGDTIHYPDNTSLPVCFKIVGDTLILGSSADKYAIGKVTKNAFWFADHSGEMLKLSRSSIGSDFLAFEEMEKQPIVMGELVKRDTVIYYDNIRYRVYTTINPSRYKVYKTVVNDDGLKVQNIYYDNIIHLAVFEGKSRLYSQDFNKKMFSSTIPEAVLNRSVFGNMSFLGVKNGGFKFRATIGVPDEAEAYRVDTVVYRVE